ncbi:MAG: GntR family transcriptional regulator [Firmicutes bacterium]|nr:GntR family transcriptional regulator [Bacillota bacterium]
MQFDPMRPIWLQVMGEIETSIVTGVRAPGEKLPGGRDLAMLYGINPNTAARVYQELEKAGLCETRRGMGTFVTGDAQRITELRIELARQAVQEFMVKIDSLGVSKEEAVKMISEME